MIPSSLVQAVLSGVLGRDRKRSQKARHYLTGTRSGLWSNPATILTAAGLAWGVVETLTQTASGAAAEEPPAEGPHPRSSAASAPPLPVPAGESETGDDGLRLIRLAIAAANADGSMNEQERAAILQQAKSGGMAEVAERELNHPKPVAEIVAGVSGREESATLYVLAFTILRADEKLTGAERIYLAQLAHLLQLDRATVEALEKDTGERIDALGDQGQPGG